MTLKEHIKHIVKAEHWDPFLVLGMHEIESDKYEINMGCVPLYSPSIFSVDYPKKVFSLKLSNK